MYSGRGLEKGDKFTSQAAQKMATDQKEYGAQAVRQRALERSDKV